MSAPDKPFGPEFDLWRKLHREVSAVDALLTAAADALTSFRATHQGEINEACGRAEIELLKRQHEFRAAARRALEAVTP